MCKFICLRINSFIRSLFCYRLTDVNAIRTETTAKQLHVITTVSKKTTFTVEETTSSFNVGQQTEPSNWGSLTGEQTSDQ